MLTKMLDESCESDVESLSHGKYASLGFQRSLKNENVNTFTLFAHSKPKPSIADGTSKEAE